MSNNLVTKVFHEQNETHYNIHFQIQSVLPNFPIEGKKIELLLHYPYGDIEENVQNRIYHKSNGELTITVQKTDKEDIMKVTILFANGSCLEDRVKENLWEYCFSIGIWDQLYRKLDNSLCPSFQDNDGKMVPYSDTFAFEFPNIQIV